MRNFWLNLLRFFLLLMIVPTTLNAQQPGQITLTGTVTAASGSSVQVQLINCGQYNPRVLYNGSLLSVVVPLTYTATPSSNGSWSVTVWPNDLLVCGGTTGASAYQVSYTQNGAPSGTPEDFQVASTGPNPYSTTVQPPLTALPPASVLHSNYNFQSLTLGNSLNAQTGSIGSLNVNSLTINGQPIAGQGQGLPNTGGTVTGTLSQNFANYFNPGFTSANVAGTINNAVNTFWSGTIPGTSAYNYGQHDFIQTYYYMNKNTPGCAGFPPAGVPCYNTEVVPVSITENNNSQGGTNVLGLSVNHYGLGDTIAQYDYLNTFGGQQDGGGPEGAELFSGGITEPANTYEGTVATAGQGQTTITANCTEDCGNGSYGFGTNPLATSTPASLGQGLIVMDEQSPTASGQIESVTNGSGETPGTITANVTAGASNLAVSTCYGTLDSALTPTSDPSGSGTQSVTFTLTLASGSGNCVAGQVASFSGYMHDQALITAVGAASGGQQSITASVRQYHEAGSYMFENPNSDAGLYMNVLANVVSGIQFPIDILGVESVSGNTAVMWYRWWFGGETPGANGLPTGNMLVDKTVSPGSLNNSGGTVTMSGGTINSVNPWLNDSTLYISNAGNSAFDGACTNSSFNASTNTVTCTQSSSTGDTATSATVSISNAAGTNPYGNSDVNFYQGAAVVNTQDTLAPITVNGQNVYPTDGKQFEVEANEMPLAAGDSLVEGHSSTYSGTVNNSRETVLNPYAYHDSGFAISLTGVAQTGGLGAGGSEAGVEITNGTGLSNYAYLGGTEVPPPAIYLQGDWNGLITALDSPQPFSSLIDEVNCSITGLAKNLCTDPGYFYNIYQLAGNAGEVYEKYWPATSTLELMGTRQFDSPGNDTAFVFHDGGYTYGIGFGGRYPDLSGAQYAPLWTGTGVNNDLPEISQCNNSSECGLADSGVPIAHIVPLPTATLALGTTAIATNSCATAQTVTVTGATTSMVAVFSGDGVLESSVSGYGAGGLKIDAAVTAANTVSIQVCNSTAASITPGALTLNVTAIQ